MIIMLNLVPFGAVYLFRGISHGLVDTSELFCEPGRKTYGRLLFGEKRCQIGVPNLCPNYCYLLAQMKMGSA
jgi:hypothetical protein